MNFIYCTLITADHLEKYTAVSKLIQGVRRLVFYGMPPGSGSAWTDGNADPDPEGKKA